MEEKYKKLKDYLKSLGAVAIAFSGGADSTFLLKTAHDVLGDAAIAVTAVSVVFPKRELDEASEFCKKEGIRQIMVESEAMDIEGFSQNPTNRCYICKTQMLSKIRRAAAELGIENIAEGSNADDSSDYRPGLAAVAEQGIKSPLRYAELKKSEIRELSEKAGLDTWDKPSFACLATRFVYGEAITAKKLGMADSAEQYLIDLGFKQVRVRVHGTMARIEVMRSEFSKAVALSEKIYVRLKDMGFTYVSLDLGGYRTGSMNVGIKEL